jgi:hypothetical protein
MILFFQQIAISMLNNAIPWGLLFGGTHYMVVRLVQSTPERMGGLICSPILRTEDNATPFISLLVFMHLRDLVFDIGTLNEEAIRDRLQVVPTASLASTRSATQLLVDGKTAGSTSLQVL